MICFTLEIVSNGEQRKLHDEALHNLYSSPNIVRMIKSGRIKWAGQVAQLGGKLNSH
jgi:hypothetical protein